MLEVLPIQDKNEQEAIANLCGVPFRTELLAYKALVDGELRGICQFKMNAEGGSIIDFANVPEKYEFEPMFVMGRAALNFIDLCGVHRAYVDAKIDNQLGKIYQIFPKNFGEYFFLFYIVKLLHLW